MDERDFEKESLDLYWNDSYEKSHDLFVMAWWNWYVERIKVYMFGKF